MNDPRYGLTIIELRQLNQLNLPTSRGQKKKENNSVCHNKVFKDQNLPESGQIY